MSLPTKVWKSSLLIGTILQMLKYTTQKQHNLNQENLDTALAYLEELKNSRSDSTRPEEFVFMNNLGQLELINTLKAKTLEHDFIVVVGIGGANLGIMAFYNSLPSAKEILFLENIDPFYNSQIINRINEYHTSGKKGLAVIISKSGSTTETMTNFALILKNFKEHYEDWASRILAFTVKGSILDNISKQYNFKSIYTSETLSDRFSVFGLASQFVLSLAGFSVEKIYESLKSSNEKFLNTNFDENDVLKYVANLMNCGEKPIYNYFVFSEKLRTFGAWQKQLFAESLGKDLSAQTPIVSIGTTDLHSMTQLYLAGPIDKYTTFISVKNYKNNLEIENIFANTDLEGLSKIKYNDMIKLIEYAVINTYKKQALEYDVITLDELNEEDFTELLQFQMLSVAVLGKLKNLNAFDQPAVDLYKEEIRNLL